MGLTTFRIDDSGDDLSDAGPSPQRVRAPRSAVPERRISGGTAAIARSLARGLPDVRLGCRARAIRPCADGVCVDVGDEVLDARQLVVALPPSLLGTQIDVEGVDDETLARLARTPVWMGDIAKVVAVYDDRFWREDGLSGRVFSRRGPMVEIHDMSGPAGSNTAALFGFVPEANAQDPSWQDAARDQLIRLFGERAADPLAFRAHAWWEDATTVPEDAPPQLDRFFGHALLRQPLLDGRIHLAASETAAVSTGHINGAVARANELARTLIETPA
ncbi:MAG: flavin monoamine oxidase family protein [Myxococcota bacterium]